MKLKKFIMLALCLALVCSLSVSVFAARTHSGYEAYDDGAAYAESYAQISQYSTSGWVDGEGYHNSASTGASCTYFYINNSGVTVFGEMSDNQPVHTTLSVTYSTDSILQMSYAYYNLWAQVPSITGTYDYERTVRVDY